jgi:hypothetical protein
MVAKKAADRNESAEVTAYEPLSDEVIAGIDSFASALELFNADSGIVQIGDVAGDGFSLLKEKESLENVPFLIIDWNEVTDPETTRDYASIRLITTDNRKYRVNDGSTGIYKQLKQIRDKHGLTTGIGVPKGLFKSEYFVNKQGEIVAKNYEGEKSKATTFYLHESS